MRHRSLFSKLVLAVIAASSLAAGGIPEFVPDVPVLTAETKMGSIVLHGAPSVAPTPKVVDGDPSDWTGQITRLGGTSIYSHGELVYQDYLGDAWGADDGVDAQRLSIEDPLAEAEPRTYRLDAFRQAAGAQFDAPAPAGAQLHYGDVNAPNELRTQADIEEARVAADAASLYFMVRTLNMQAPARTAVVVLLDTEPGGSYPTFGGLTTGAEWSFLAAANDVFQIRNRGAGVSGACQPPCPPPPWRVASNENGFTNTLEISVGRTFVEDPSTVGVGIATGLIDGNDLLDVRSGDAKSSLVNVAFRSEPARVWMDKRQALALRDGNIDAFSVPIDLAALEAGTTQTFTQRPGYYEAIYVVDSPANEERVVNAYFQGPYQHYGLYLPDTYDHGSRYPAMFWMHYRGGHAHDAAAWLPGVLRQFGDEKDSIVVTPSGRGESTWYTGRGMLDYRNVWDDVMSRWNVEEDRVYLGGHSMGGYASWLLGLTMPDRWAAANPENGPLVPGLWLGAGDPIEPQNGQDINATFLVPLLGNARNLPYAILHGTLDELVPVTGALAAGKVLGDLGYRYRVYAFHTYEHYSAPIMDDWREMARYMWSFRRDKNPTHVSYTRWPALEHALSTTNVPANVDLGFRFDGAYWVSGMRTRTNGIDPANRGTVNATTLGRGGPGAVPLPEAGACGQVEPCTMHGQTMLRGPSAVPENAFRAHLTNLSDVTFDLARMSISAAAPISFGVATDGPVTIRLIGTWSNAPVVINASSSWADGVLTLTVTDDTEISINP